MTFSDLGIGTRFEFDHTGLPLSSGIATGPWVKVSTRQYTKVGEPARYTVGTVRVPVTVQLPETPCSHCGDPTPSDRSCGCWDNHSQ